MRAHAFPVALLRQARIGPSGAFATPEDAPRDACRSLAQGLTAFSTDYEGKVMQTEVGHEHEIHHHKQRHLAEKFEGVVGIAMVVAIVILGALLIYGIMQTGNATPTYLR